jgi:hypothetical protein
MQKAMRQAIKNKIIDEYEDMIEDQKEKVEHIRVEEESKILKTRDSILHMVKYEMDDIINEHLENDP